MWENEAFVNNLDNLMLLDSRTQNPQEAWVIVWGIMGVVVMKTCPHPILVLLVV